MRNRIVALVVCELLLVAGGLWTIGHQALPLAPASPALFAGYVAGFTALVLLPPMYVELRRHACWLTPAEFAIPLGLFGLGPVGFLAAAMIAEAVAAVRRPQAALKTTFNLVNMAGGYTAAATTFAVLGRTDPLDPVAWLCGVAAVAACVLWDLVSTAAVLAIAEGQPFRSVLRQLGSAAAVSLVLSALPAVAAVVLFNATPLGPLLFAPVLGVLLISTRSVSAQRAERIHFERLYEASSDLARLVSLPDMLATVARQARGLMTGAAAICCTVRADGSWTGVLVDDHGSHPTTDRALAALVELTIGGDAAAETQPGRDRGEAAAGHVGRHVRALLPAFTSMVWASKKAEPSGTVLLAVFRELASDEQGDHRSDVLTAFVAHAATAVANVGLHEDVQESLQRQVELNQQKGDFVAAVSHELRTPLTAMIGSVQTMKRLGDRMPEQDRIGLLDMGLSQGARLRGLIDDLLLVAAADHRTVKCVREPVAVGPLLAELGAELGGSIGERLQFLPLHEQVTVETDSDKLRRIIANLVVNAGKYAPEGAIEVRAERRDRDLVVTVSDEGPGIPPQDRERIFERFVQLDQSATRRQGGTGLGLHLCRQLTQVLGGSLSVGDAPQGGALFTLVLTDAVIAGDVAVAAGAPRPPLPAGMARSPLSRPGAGPAVRSRPVPPAVDAADARAVPGPAVRGRAAGLGPGGAVRSRPAAAGTGPAVQSRPAAAGGAPLPPGMARSPLKRPADAPTRRVSPPAAQTAPAVPEGQPRDR